MGKVGVHTQQPLVLVNYGGALGNDILSLAHYIQEQVEKHFQIPLEMEVNVW
jgi:UDP-N-acetylmuramate dehydrogenase